MKRFLIITGGVLLILLLAGVWVYILINGGQSNSADEQFADLSLGDTTDTSFVPLPPSEPTVDVAGGVALRQLTTRPVAGFAEVRPDASSTPAVHYVELGTGHIFRIDLETGQEERVSATTIPLTTEAVLTPNGQHVFLETPTEHIVGTLASSSDTLRNFALREPVADMAASLDNEFFYLTPNGNETLARAYNPQSNTIRTLFTIPFRAVAINWGTQAAGPHYVYPKASADLRGAVYQYENGVMERLPIAGYGLSVVGGDSGVLASRVNTAGEYESVSQTPDGPLTSVAISVIPDKCERGSGGFMICGANLEEYPTDMPDAWYRGSLTTSDSLWDVSLSAGSATFLVDIEAETGRAVDIETITSYPGSSLIFFSNKLDNALWVYDVAI